MLVSSQGHYVTFQLAEWTSDDAQITKIGLSDASTAETIPKVATYGYVVRDLIGIWEMSVDIASNARKPNPKPV